MLFCNIINSKIMTSRTLYDHNMLPSGQQYIIRTAIINGDCRTIRDLYQYRSHFDKSVKATNIDIGISSYEISEMIIKILKTENNYDMVKLLIENNLNLNIPKLKLLPVIKQLLTPIKYKNNTYYFADEQRLNKLRQEQNCKIVRFLFKNINDLSKEYDNFLKLSSVQEVSDKTFVLITDNDIVDYVANYIKNNKDFEELTNTMNIKFKIPQTVTDECFCFHIQQNNQHYVRKLFEYGWRLLDVDVIASVLYFFSPQSKKGNIGLAMMFLYYYPHLILPYKATAKCIKDNISRKNWISVDIILKHGFRLNEEDYASALTLAVCKNSMHIIKLLQKYNT